MTAPEPTTAELPELVIFDCDGVLVDSERLAVELELQVASDWQFEITRQQFVDRYMGRAAGLFIEDLQRHIGRPWTDAEQEAHTALCREKFARELTAVNGVTQAIERLPKLHCVASSSAPDALRWKLEHCELLPHFGERAVFSGHQVKNGKPAPDLFLYAAEQMGVAASDCVVIEDSEHGVNAARAAGMHVFAYVTGMVPVTQLNGPDTTLFDDMTELPDMIAEHWRARSPTAH